MRRIQHGDWFIQATRGKTQWVAWASKERLDTVFAPSKYAVYFNFGKTEAEAFDNITRELDEILAESEK